MTSEQVTFTTPDGLRLEGTLRAGTNGRVALLCHMHHGAREDWDPLAARLHDAGYTVLAINHRGSGASDGPEDSSKADQDVLGAVDYLVARGEERVYPVGASMGGAGSLIAAAAGKPAIRAVVAISAPDEWGGLHVHQFTSRIRVPVVFIGASEDPDGLAPAVRMAPEDGPPRSWNWRGRCTARRSGRGRTPRRSSPGSWPFSRPIRRRARRYSLSSRTPFRCRWPSSM